MKSLLNFGVVSFVVMLLVMPCQAQDSLSVTEIKICTGVEDREPVGVAAVFPDTVGKVYCFTKIEGAKSPTTISHVWYHGDEKRAEVALDIKGTPWRTWTSKTVLKEWTGDWRVEIVAEDSTVLKEAAFEIEGEKAQ